MKIKALKKEILKVVGKDQYIYIKNLVKSRDSKDLYFAVYRSSSLEACFHMKPNGTIIAVTYQKDDDHLDKYQHLVGEKIDLYSFDFDYQRIIHDRTVQMNDSSVVGEVLKGGKILIYTPQNIGKIVFPRRYRGNQDRLTPHGGYEASQLFKKIAHQYRTCIIAGSVQCRSITYYKLTFLIHDVTVVLTLSKFFQYGIQAQVCKNKKVLVTLDYSSEVSQLDDFIQEATSGILSLATKTRILTKTYGVSSTTFEQLPNSQVIATLRFDGERGRPRGSYEFVFDFAQNVVTCSNGEKSKKFIPEVLRKFNENFSAHQQDPQLYFK